MQRKIFLLQKKSKKVDKGRKIMNNKKLGQILLKKYEKAQKIKKELENMS